VSSIWNCCVVNWADVLVVAVLLTPRPGAVPLEFVDAPVRPLVVDVELPERVLLPTPTPRSSLVGEPGVAATEPDRNSDNESRLSRSVSSDVNCWLMLELLLLRPGLRLTPLLVLVLLPTPVLLLVPVLLLAPVLLVELDVELERGVPDMEPEVDERDVGRSMPEESR
jgi:hypothetical protein